MQYDASSARTTVTPAGAGAPTTVPDEARYEARDTSAALKVACWICVWASETVLSLEPLPFIVSPPIASAATSDRSPMPRRSDMVPVSATQTWRLRTGG